MSQPLSFRVVFDGSGLRTGAKVRKPALLFKAGEYPDKGVAITTDDLDGIISRFSGSVPVRAEHRESPLDPLGEVVALYRDGDELYAMLHFSDGMAAHIEERGARNLSVSFLKDADGNYTMDECSIVFAGRVPGAGFLPQRSAADVAARVAQFQAAGKLTPGMIPAAAAIFSISSPVQFSGGGTVDPAAELAALLDAMPAVRTAAPGVKVADFSPGGTSSTGPVAKPGENPNLDASQNAFLAALALPGGKAA